MTTRCVCMCVVPLGDSIAALIDSKLVYKFLVFLFLKVDTFQRRKNMLLIV